MKAILNCPMFTWIVNSYRIHFIPRQNYVVHGVWIQNHENNKPGTYVKGYTDHYICIKFESSSIKNGIKNAK